MSWVHGVLTVAVVAGIGGGVLKAMEPQTPAQARQEQRIQQEKEGGEAKKRTDRRLRDEGNEAADADRQEKLRPAERRPQEPPPRVKVRLR